MLRRKVKAFTLIEVLMTILVLGVSALLLCQAYVQLMNVTNGNNTITASIGQQMASAEAGSDDSVYVKKFRESTNYTVELTSVANNSGSSIPSKAYRDSDKKYTAKVDVYSVKAVGVQGNTLDESSTKQGADVRYVYFH